MFWPSTWWAAVAVPHRKPVGKVCIILILATVLFRACARDESPALETTVASYVSGLTFLARQPQPAHPRQYPGKNTIRCNGLKQSARHGTICATPTGEVLRGGWVAKLAPHSDTARQGGRGPLGHTQARTRPALGRRANLYCGLPRLRRQRLSVPQRARAGGSRHPTAQGERLGLAQPTKYVPALRQ